jgi:hypothetical protein
MFFKTYAELVTYFEGLTATVTGLNGVTVGADEELLDQQSSRIKYPHLRVDTPEIRFVNEDENMATQYTFRMYVMTNGPTKTNKEENQRLSDMARLCERLIRRLWQDADADKFDIIQGDKTGDAIRRWSGDNCLGWWFSITIQLYTDECA